MFLLIHFGPFPQFVLWFNMFLIIFFPSYFSNSVCRKYFVTTNIIIFFSYLATSSYAVVVFNTYPWHTQILGIFASAISFCDDIHVFHIWVRRYARRRSVFCPLSLALCVGVCVCACGPWRYCCYGMQYLESAWYINNDPLDDCISAITE